MINIFRPTYAEINLSNLDHNMATILNLAGKGRFVCPMIKANAYGHGAVQVAQRILQNQRLPLGVSLVEEALELREAGISSEIIIFGGFDRQGVKKIIEAHLTPVVSQFEHLDLLIQNVSGSIDIHLKFNTGMNRLGFNPDDVEKIISILNQQPKIKLKAVLSHLHSAHLADQENSAAIQQARLMVKITEHFKKFGVFVHLLSSDAIIHAAELGKKNPNHILVEPQWGFRPGIMLYGYRSQNFQSDVQIKPVMSLKSHVQDVRNVKKGEVVSYNATWTAEKDSTVAIIPIGYADGVHRLLSNRGNVFIKNQAAPMIGRVCMDFIMADVTQLNSALLKNEEVIFFDDRHQGADQVAEKAETISYEILTAVSSRVPRRYVDTGALA